MKKLILTTLVLALATLATSNAFAAGRRCRTYAPVAVQPAPVAVARAENGYRAFSYQPGAATNVGVVRRTTRAAQPGYMNAGTKATGRY